MSVLMSKDKDPESRKWLLTINNPVEKGFTHEYIKEQLNKLKLLYWCMSDEVGGTEHTFHTHVYIVRGSGIRATRIAKLFPFVHRDIAHGTSQENKDYVFKQGKWLNTEKETTNIKDSHEEWGDMPIERPGARNDLADLYDMIKDGYTDGEILAVDPSYLKYIDKIERVRQTLLCEDNADRWRNVRTTYIWGLTGTGKTRTVMETYGYRKVYRVTDYDHPFDSYKGQDVIVFDEFRSSLQMTQMLDYLDGYPVELKARYCNKQACFTKVYIISNIDLRDQYPTIQREDDKTWQAFLRRIKEVQVFDGKDVHIVDCQEYIKSDWKPCFDAPFQNKDDNKKTN